MIRNLLSAVMLLSMAGWAHAAIIGFEAESGTLGSEFDPAQSDVGALGGSYITTETNNVTPSGIAPNSDAFTVSYSLNVPAGTYNIYIRARIGNGDANDDSFHRAAAFGDANPTNAAHWVTSNGLSGFGIPKGSTGPFGWSTALGTITSPGGTVQWEIGAREDGFDIDAFAFVTQGQTVTASELDEAVAIPEPASMALLGLGGLLIARRRTS